MSMTYLQLQDFALGDDFDATTRREDAKRFVNQGLGRLHRAHRLPTQDARAIVSTVAGTNVYSLPADFVSLVDDEAVLYGTDVLEPYDITDFDQLTALSGQPRSFALSENLILLYPNPDAVYELTMRYRAVQTLSADADVPTISADRHPDLGWFARAKLYLLADDPDMHAQIMATLPRVMQDANPANDQQFVPRRRQVGGHWGGLPTGARFHHPDGLW
jgi:hypothetical protein